MGAIEIIIEPRTRDLGGFTVGRVLPYAKRRMVGPFIFFDVMGPNQFAPGQGIDVRPHPHINLATVTYLYDGEIWHRDNLGYDQIIKPGDVNWMTAGRGIVHSERTEPKTREAGQFLHGIQSWVALPESDAETDPEFFHHPKASLPEITMAGVEMRLIAGDAFGEKSPVKTYSGIFYLDIQAQADAKLELPDNHEERAFYLVDGDLKIDGEDYAPGRLIVFKPSASPTIEALSNAKIMALGGEPLGKRVLWWNFVAASNERLNQAKTDWLEASQSGFKEGVFTLPPDETEYIPLPEA
ncbi:MAG: pirin family protein [Pseudomonadota bacterium]